MRKGFKESGFTRREFLKLASATAGIAPAFLPILSGCRRSCNPESAFIAKVDRYDREIASIVFQGMGELGVTAGEIRGKRVLLKPNLVEPHIGAGHINTHPSIVHGVAEAFRRYGAAEVLVADGPAHCMDTRMVLEESRLDEVLREDRLRFVDLNYDDGYPVPNRGGFSRFRDIVLPMTLSEVDLVVSLAKMKTHHWAGITLSMKNLFGLFPGTYYGWPKNALHFEGIDKCVLDINATVRPFLSIVDGIVGMEGDGPIMGNPRQAGVLVLGRNLAAVDATGARIMGVDPHRIPHIAAASGRIGPIRETDIRQVGETIRSVRTDFLLLDEIPAQKGIRLAISVAR
jgi:uncharacterized protein (DUF362 family)